MEQKFCFETDYDINALSAMARALRKTIRKKQSRRSHILGWTVTVLGLLVTVTMGVNIVTLTAIVILVLFLLFEDRANGYMAKKRALPGTEHCRSQFYQDKFLSITKVGKTDFRYDRIKYVAEDRGYFVFILSNSHAQAYDKKRLTGGSCEEFRSFIEDRTGLKVIPISGFSLF
ncbi:MAG TPA: YcxB family protein [Candidatus Eisenbergiella merdipullorum]|uniref:YcxB family protein n=1 Tax=Candidatus Eisenbergiella merdipullorum TaxID=2838553 RepID=A0A9D2I2R6_9FIRM|nr:YcxB family protein [Candidatus Eisenbergiella merdipullorum]